jgi:hypothetical protein
MGENRTMNAFKIVKHKEKDVVIIDISNQSAIDIVKGLRSAQEEIIKYPEKSLLVLTDATNAVYNSLTSTVIKDFAEHNTKYVKASAVIGVDGIKGALLKTVSLITKRDIQNFKNQNEALDWLVTQ